MFKPRMTPAELAELTGYKAQTINRWVTDQQWQTVPLKGVKGGKAHLIIVDDRVREYVSGTRKMQSRAESYHLAEPVTAYGDDAAQLENQLRQVAQAMTPYERQQLSALILREGISGLLKRLGIKDE
ncbi:putative DNA-binding transcriptional regulator [Atlantibacter hermannii]|nr:YfeC-like transcriptional regulator [Atlantibacter hermannii]NBC99980.1 putative DNA-binding transcriptional regulator [Atlantibacter hermannii]